MEGAAPVQNVWAARAAANAKENEKKGKQKAEVAAEAPAAQKADGAAEQPAVSEEVSSEDGKDDGEYETVKVKVKQECAGFIVGPLGRVINEIARQTFTHIHSPRRGEDSVFVISGPRLCVKAASALVRIKELEALEREDTPADTTSKTGICTVPESLVGFVMGAQRSVITDISRQTRTEIVCPVKGGKPQFTVTGMPPCVDAAITCIEAKVLQAGAASWPNTQSFAHETISITVPADRVGLVVGSLGSTITQIAVQTGTTIISPKKGQDPVFQISGPKHFVELAKSAIEQRVQTGGKGSGPPRKDKGKQKQKKPFHSLPSVVTWLSGAAAR
mmetsp:Transcript_18207/g.43374  ORF Transcript_18207/g.43374 Transcript_18207/m.43374 type:complete len:332 (+) Transcript_18207:175-1170(+)